MTRSFYPLLGVSLLVAAGLLACDKPGPAESAGKAIDQTANDAGKKMSETADKIDKKLDDAGNKASAAIADSEITTRIKAAFLADPGLDAMKIMVDTVGGIVTLSGTVESSALADKAQALAAAVTGVKDVVNHLTIATHK